MRRHDLPQLALELRHLGELLVHDCRCDIATHRWRHDTCTYRQTAEDNPNQRRARTSKVIYTCTNGYVTIGAQVFECPDCWTSCREGHFLDQTGDIRPCPLCRPHSIAEHLWRSADDMAPGVRAANTDPGGGNRWEEDDSGEVWPVPNDTTGDTALEQPGPAPFAEYMALLDQARDTSQLTDFIQRHRPDRHAPTRDPTSDSEYCRHHLNTVGTCEPRFRGDCCRDCYRFNLMHDTLPPRSLLEAKRDGKRWTPQMVADALKAAKPTNNKKKRHKAS